MLKGISPIISPELLKIIAEMGHGDELVISDGNFPGTSIGKRCVRCDGHGAAEVMKADVQLFPLDDFVKAPLAVMEVPSAEFDMMEHDAFIERARNAYAVVQTGETALYGNIIIRKGVVRL